jgi:putative restriction endonuclease
MIMIKYFVMGRMGIKGIMSYGLKKQRSNQYLFRKILFEYWKGCAVTGIKNEAFLVASHIIPWNKCSDSDKLNKFNGLLLLAPLDFLFDNYHLTFDEHGNGILSSAGKKLAKSFGITSNIKLMKFEKKFIPFLKEHRKNLIH